MNAPVELEGFNLATSLLRRYQIDSETWDLPKEGEFWDAVALAHELRRSGEGCRVAVIDGGFDTQIPALSECPVWGAQGTSSAHGTDEPD